MANTARLSTPARTNAQGNNEITPSKTHSTGKWVANKTNGKRLKLHNEESPVVTDLGDTKIAGAKDSPTKESAVPQLDFTPVLRTLDAHPLQGVDLEGSVKHLDYETRDTGVDTFPKEPDLFVSNGSIPSESVEAVLLPQSGRGSGSAEPSVTSEVTVPNTFDSLFKDNMEFTLPEETMQAGLIASALASHRQGHQDWIKTIKDLSDPDPKLQKNTMAVDTGAASAAKSCIDHKEIESKDEGSHQERSRPVINPNSSMDAGLAEQYKLEDESKQGSDRKEAISSGRPTTPPKDASIRSDELKDAATHAVTSPASEKPIEDDDNVASTKRVRRGRSATQARSKGDELPSDSKASRKKSSKSTQNEDITPKVTSTRSRRETSAQPSKSSDTQSTSAAPRRSSRTKRK